MELAFLYAGRYSLKRGAVEKLRDFFTHLLKILSISLLWILACGDWLIFWEQWQSCFWVTSALGLSPECELALYSVSQKYLFQRINRVFPILYWISTCTIRWIQLESVKHDWRLLKALCVSPTHSWIFNVIVMTPDWESEGYEFKFLFLEIKA